MNINLLTAGALVAALGLPVAAGAQQSQPPPTQARARTVPSQSVLQAHWMNRLGGLNLSSQQQQQIQTLINQYAQAHPEGSPRDKHASKALRKQIMGVLTPDQIDAYKQQMQAKRAQHQRMQQQQPADQQPDQQQPDNQPPI